MKTFITIIIPLLFFYGVSNAQKDIPAKQRDGKPFVLGRVDELNSVQLSEKRTLNIYLPDGYDADSNAHKIYPVIYLLDGSANEDFIHVVGIVQFLSMITEAMPPTIVVGIANVDRKRDFTFPTSIEKDKKDFPTTGGSAKFISFLEKDLEPYIQKNYRVGSRTIIGQSLGGLLATEVLLTKPALFDNYVIVSPSLWWDNESLLKKAPGMLRLMSSKKINVYLTVGDEEKQMIVDAHQLGDLLRQRASDNFKVTFANAPGENHLTILHNVVYKALVKLNLPK